MPHFDDNFGSWDNDEDDGEFYRQVQRESILKTCSICKMEVRLRPQYDKCNTCCEKIERGGGW